MQAMTFSFFRGHCSLRIICFILLTGIYFCSGELTGEFNSLVAIGNETRSNDEPVQILITKEYTAFVGGTTSPEEHGKESDLGEPITSGLQREDIFITKIMLNQTAVSWVYRIGTANEDELHAMILDSDEKHLYIGGRTFGQFVGTTRKGQADLFVIKIDISGTRPREVWERPLVIGSEASDSVSELMFDPLDSNLIYATGFTGGNLFDGHRNSDIAADGILFSFSADAGKVVNGIQFGTAFSDQGTGIVVSNTMTGSIFVSATTERKIGQYTFGNFHLYKFDKQLNPLGNLLLKTFSREENSAFVAHPTLSNNLFSSGSSWLDTKNGYDVFVKRIVTPFDNVDIGEFEVNIDEVDREEYTRRYRSTDGSHDYCSGALLDPDSGRLVVTGYTGGSFVSGSSSKGILAPFVASVDPVDGEMTDAKQLQLKAETDWIEIASSALTPTRDGIYYVTKQSNEQTSQFFMVIGKFLFPPTGKPKLS